MNEEVQEYATSHGVAVRVDRQAGLLRGVKLIGLESANGRTYRPTALAGAISLYEGAKVNVNHPKEGPLAPRDYRDRLGVIRQAEFRPGEGLFGNLHFNPKHPLAEQLAWDAEHNPRNVGFSHNVLARLSREGERTVVEEIAHVQSVDLVADPAATRGLFEESQAPVAQPAPATASSKERLLARERGEGDPQQDGERSALPAGVALSEAMLEELRRQRPDLCEALHEATERARPRAREQSLAVGDIVGERLTTQQFVRLVRGQSAKRR